MYIGNTILVDHNIVKTMGSLIDNVMLVEKWNHRVEIFSKYLMGASPSLFRASSFHK
jgi:hypothetical protein